MNKYKILIYLSFFFNYTSLSQKAGNIFDSRKIIEKWLGKSIEIPCEINIKSNLKVGEISENFELFKSNINNKNLKLLFNWKMGENDCLEYICWFAIYN